MLGSRLAILSPKSFVLLYGPVCKSIFAGIARMSLDGISQFTAHIVQMHDNNEHYIRSLICSHRSSKEYIAKIAQKNQTSSMLETNIINY